MRRTEVRCRIDDGRSGGGAVRARASGAEVTAHGETGTSGTPRHTVTTVMRTEAGAAGLAGAAMQQLMGGAERRTSGQQS